MKPPRVDGRLVDPVVRANADELNLIIHVDLGRSIQLDTRWGDRADCQRSHVKGAFDLQNGS